MHPILTITQNTYNSNFNDRSFSLYEAEKLFSQFNRLQELCPDVSGNFTYRFSYRNPNADIWDEDYIKIYNGQINIDDQLKNTSTPVLDTISENTQNPAYTGIKENLSQLYAHYYLSEIERESSWLSRYQTPDPETVYYSTLIELSMTNLMRVSSAEDLLHISSAKVPAAPPTDFLSQKPSFSVFSLLPEMLDYQNYCEVSYAELLKSGRRVERSHYVESFSDYLPEDYTLSQVIDLTDPQLYTFRTSTIVEINDGITSEAYYYDQGQFISVPEFLVPYHIEQLRKSIDQLKAITLDIPIEQVEDSDINL